MAIVPPKKKQDLEVLLVRETLGLHVNTSDKMKSNATTCDPVS